MSTFHYSTEQFLPVHIDKAWEFFSSAQNLSLITPAEMQMKITSAPLEKEIYAGMRIRYRLKPLLGIPVNWQTEISRVDKPYSFVDKQIRGPYSLWEHTHSFVEKGNGVLIKDHVKYKLPFGLIGTLVHTLIVKKKIKDIFEYRKNMLNKIFRNYGTIPG